MTQRTMPRPGSAPVWWLARSAAVVLSLSFVACGGGGQGPAQSPTAMPNQVPVGYGTASLSWTPVTTDTSGTPLADLAGYKVYYGTSPGELDTAILVQDPSATAYVVNYLASGTWYFAVAAYTTGGIDGARSNVASKTIP